MSTSAPQLAPRSTGTGRRNSISKCYSRALLRASVRLQRLYEDEFKPSGLRQVEYAMLAEIDENGSMSLGDLGRDYTFDRSGLRYRLEPLVDRGLVAMTVDPRDRRGRDVTLTDKGRDVLATAREMWLNAQGRLEAALGREHADALRDALKAIASTEFEAAFAKHGVD